MSRCHLRPTCGPPEFPEIEFGAHLHTQPHNWEEKIEAAWESGCHRFDGALRGFGGCPMAKDDLTGNMATENLLKFFTDRDIPLNLDQVAFGKSMELTTSVFY